MGQRDPVDVLEIAPYWKSSGESGHPNPHPGEKLLDVGGRDLSLHRGIRRQDDLADSSLSDSLNQVIQAQ
jgi:hypothetical protein